MKKTLHIALFFSVLSSLILPAGAQTFLPSRQTAVSTNNFSFIPGTNDTAQKVFDWIDDWFGASLPSPESGIMPGTDIAGATFVDGSWVGLLPGTNIVGAVYDPTNSVWVFDESITTNLSSEVSNLTERVDAHDISIGELQALVGGVATFYTVPFVDNEAVVDITNGAFQRMVVTSDNAVVTFAAPSLVTPDTIELWIQNIGATNLQFSSENLYSSSPNFGMDGSNAFVAVRYLASAFSDYAGWIEESVFASGGFAEATPGGAESTFSSVNNLNISTTTNNILGVPHRVHYFYLASVDSPGSATLALSDSAVVRQTIIGGGGGGGSSYGGGGGGGEVKFNAANSLAAGSYAITVGKRGLANGDGGSSSFAGTVAAGGSKGAIGGSYGPGAAGGASGSAAGGAAGPYAGGGGAAGGVTAGGAASTTTHAPSSVGGSGAAGILINDDGSETRFGAGGGGGSWATPGGGGAGGGGTGGNSFAGGSNAAGYGGGGGGAGSIYTDGAIPGVGKEGVVIIAYPITVP